MSSITVCVKKFNIRQYIWPYGVQLKEQSQITLINLNLYDKFASRFRHR